MSEPDVIVVGAGPGGVSAAWALTEAGRTVLHLDAGEMPRPGGAGARFDATELAGCGSPTDEARESYARAERRIGASGDGADDLAPYFARPPTCSPPPPSSGPRARAVKLARRSFASLPAKPPASTIMANADRIGGRVAALCAE